MQLRWENSSLKVDLDEATPSPRGGSVVLVDANPVVVKVIGLQLKDWGYAVRSAATPEEGLACTRDGQTDAVVIGMRLSGMGSLGLLAALKGEAPDLPAIMLVSAATPTDVIAAMRTGAFDYIVLEEVPLVRQVLFDEAPTDEAPNPLGAAVERAVDHTRLVRYGIELNRQLSQSNAELDLERRQLKDALLELRRAQAKLVRAEKAASMTVASHGVANAICNPLTVLTSGLHTLRDWARQMERERPASERQGQTDEVFRELEQGVDRIRDTVDAMRKFASLRAVSWQRVQLEPLVKELVSSVTAERRGDTTLVVDCALSAPVRANRTRLEQALGCLLDNALEACRALPPGRGVIRLGARESAGAAVLEVADNGPGIPPEYLPRVFDLFFTTRLGRNARGMGLPLAQEILGHLGGELSLTSTVGQGTTALVELPLWSTADDDDGTSPKTTSGGGR